MHQYVESSIIIQAQTEVANKMGFLPALHLDDLNYNYLCFPSVCFFTIIVKWTENQKHNSCPSINIGNNKLVFSIPHLETNYWSEIILFVAMCILFLWCLHRGWCGTSKNWHLCTTSITNKTQDFPTGIKSMN